MSSKSIWQGLEGLMGDLTGARKTLATVEQRCPVCSNALDPLWTKCPYCEAAQNANTRSSPVVQEAAAPAAVARRPTVVDSGAPVQPSGSAVAAVAAAAGSAPVRRPTIVDPGSAAAAGSERRPGAGGRRIAGIVTTFTWSPQGKLFQILDGRNFGGSGVVGSENNRPCDIQVPEDETMSSSHFLVLCQGGKYIISDTFSTNGTFLNGTQIDTRGTDLPDRSVIRAGATVFVFQKIQAAQADVTGPLPDGEQGWKPDDRDGTVQR